MLFRAGMNKVEASLPLAGATEIHYMCLERVGMVAPHGFV